MQRQISPCAGDRGTPPAGDAFRRRQLRHALHRIAEILVGTVIGVATALFVLPDRGATGVRIQGAAAILRPGTTLHFAHAVLRRDPADLADRITERRRRLVQTDRQ